MIEFIDVSKEIDDGHTTLQCLVRNAYIGFIGWDNKLNEYAFFPYNKITSYNGDVLLHIYDRIYYLMKGRILS